jgi:beta-aspartyl-peptidase (threonine type)
MKTASYLFMVILAALSCARDVKPDRAPLGHWAIAIHGGAGVIAKDIPDSIRIGYEKALETALQQGKNLLESGVPALDVVVQVIETLENDPHFNAGKGAVYNSKGEHELDASIMDGQTLACGSVAGVKTVKNPIKLARLVMEKTAHVLLAGTGAEEFADETGVERVPNSWFDTPHRYEAFERARQKYQQETQVIEVGHKKGTVGCVVLDRSGNLAAGTSTGGMTFKKFGRVGDTPIIGAGNFASNETCAISCTGTGEAFIRHGVARDIHARMKYKNLNLIAASNEVVHGVLKPGDGGIIGVSRTGEIAMVFNTSGMFRGAADASGRFEVKIWE